jgi:hypothetical protein
MITLAPFQCTEIAQGSVEQCNVGEGKDAAKSPLEGYKGTCLTRYSGVGIQNCCQRRSLSPEQVPMTSDSPVRHFGALGVGKGHFWRELTFEIFDCATMHVSARPLLLEPLPSAELSDRRITLSYPKISSSSSSTSYWRRESMAPMSLRV